MIVAAARNGVIGADGDLPWRLPGDLRRFKARTMGGAVIMGRATFESIGRPLPGRRNVVLTRRAGYETDGIVVVHEPDQALAVAEGHEPVHVIGGATVYRELLAHVDRIDLTVVEAEPAGDTYLDPLDGSGWVCVAETEGEGTPHHVFHELERSHDGAGLPCLPSALVAVQSAS